MYYKYFILLFIIFTARVQSQNLGFTLPDIEAYQLNNGMRILISPNYESPIINISIHINAGKLDDPIDKPDLGKYAFWALNDGTNKYPKEDQLKEKLFSFGNTQGSFRTMGFYDDYARISNLCLKEDTRDCIEIFSEVLRYPTFPFYNELMQKLTLIWAPNSTFVGVSNSTWYHAKYMYSGLIQYFDPAEQLSYSRKEAVNWYNEHIRPENITLMISGDINYIYIKKLINEYFSDWEPSVEISENKESNNIKVIDNSGINITFTSLEDETEARILILKETTELNKFWDPAMQMALYVFAKSRRNKINQKIDKAGWIGYGWAQSNRMPYFNITGNMPYSHLGKFYRELIAGFEDLSNNSITDEELRSAKITRINDYQNRLYDINELEDFVQYYYNNNGYSLEKIPQMIDDINAVTLDEVNAAAKKVFDPDNFVMSIAGNQDSCATFLGQFSNIEYYEAAEEIRVSNK